MRRAESSLFEKLIVRPRPKGGMGSIWQRKVNKKEHEVGKSLVCLRNAEKASVAAAQRGKDEVKRDGEVRSCRTFQAPLF